MSELDHPARQLILNFPSHPEFRFSNFVVSEGSQFAFDASQQLASAPGVPYNTLFLFGGKNLGKTHLLISIGNQVTEHGKTAVYMAGREFVRKTEGVNSTTVNDMITKLTDTDVFLLDDVEELAGRRSAQEKLYFIYNTLVEKSRYIVCAGLRPPDRLDATEGYLKSRFQWGVTAEVKPIDDATTAKIISKLGQDIGLIIPDKIIDYLLTRIPRDFLSIKHTVTRINQESYVQKKKVSVPLVKATLDLP